MLLDHCLILDLHHYLILDFHHSLIDIRQPLDQPDVASVDDSVGPQPAPALLGYLILMLCVLFFSVP